ncbi:MAG: PilZ domain-containing protein [Terriglobia bacterium]
MAAPPIPGSTPGALLACAQCGERHHFTLDRFQQLELYQKQQIRHVCPHCQELTTWYAVEPDRRKDVQRRSSRHVKMALAVRVRGEADNACFTEITQTLNVARDGCRFFTKKPLREGMHVFLVMPYHGAADDALPETRAEVIRVEELADGKAVAVRFVR